MPVFCNIVFLILSSRMRVLVVQLYYNLINTAEEIVHNKPDMFFFSFECYMVEMLELPTKHSVCKQFTSVLMA